MIELRVIKPSDLNILFEWRNNKHIISLSASQKGVTLVEHTKWFNHIIVSPSTKIFIILNGQKPIGQVRFDKILEQETCCEVSIYLIPGEENKGIGSKALSKGIFKILQLWKIDQIFALIRVENKKSQLFFKKHDFKKVIKSGKFIRFIYHTTNQLNDLIKENQEFYDRRVVKYGSSYKSLNWGSKKSQQERFKVLVQIGELNDKRILDFGCGVGDFLEWINNLGIDVDYTGIDISKKMVEKAKEKFPKGHFYQKNIFTSPLDKNFDYIFLSGIFTYTNKTFFEKCIILLYDNCNLGIGFNLLSTWFENKSNKEFYANPSDVIKFCKKLTKKIIFRHDYHPRDFTIFLYK